MDLLGMIRDWQIDLRYIYLWFTFFCTVYTQDAFKVSLNISRNNDILPGTQVNMTCEFMVTEKNYRDVRWTVGNGPMLIRYTDLLETNKIGASVKDSGLTLSSDPNEPSVQWLTLEVNLCNESSTVGDYKCTALDQSRSFSDASAKLQFKPPKRSFYLNDTEICDGRSEENLWELGLSTSDPLVIKFTTTNERSKIIEMAIITSTTSFTKFNNTSSKCAFNASVTGVDNISTQENSKVKFEIKLDGKEVETITCTLTAAHTTHEQTVAVTTLSSTPSDSTQEQTVTDAMPSSASTRIITSGTTSEKLKEGAIAGIVLGVIIVVIGLVLLLIVVKKKIDSKK